MSRSVPARSRRGSQRRWQRPPPVAVAVCFALLLALGWAGAAVAQEPVQVPDTLPPDTLTEPSDSVAEEPEPPPVLVDFPRAADSGWGPGVWVWDQDALLASTALTLTDLLERIPGIVPIRSGLFALPEGASMFGATAGRIEVVLDGFALDPLAASSPDLSRFELVNLRSVRVERRLDRLRVELETVAPTEGRPYTRIEAGTGDLGSNLFRGIFLAPRVLGGPLGVGIDRLSTEGFFRVEPANTFTGWGKWALIRGSSGVEVELRRSSTDRNQPADLAVSESRTDLVVRARTQPHPRLTAEAFLGNSAIEVEQPEVLERSRQAGFRAAFDGGPLQLDGVVRNRSHEDLPQWETELNASANLPGNIGLTAGLSREDWTQAESAMTYGVGSRVGLFGGLGAIAELTRGQRGVPFVRDSVGSPVLTERNGWRVGAELDRRTLGLGVAALQLETDRVPAFGLAFDTPIGSPAALHRGATVTGWEAAGRLQLPWEPLSIEAYYTEWNSGRRWIYLPARTAGAALVYNHVPLSSGNLRIVSRIEGRHRGSMLTAKEVDGVSAVPGLTTFDFHLQINIIDVRLFLRWENITHRIFISDLPERLRPGQRLFYGVKWNFIN